MSSLQLDYDEKDQSKRTENVRQVLDGEWYGGTKGLSNMADYMLFTNDSRTTKTERNQRYPIQSRNRKVTTDRRETSLDALAEALETSPLSIYDLMDHNSNSLLDARSAITEEDLERYPELRQCVEVLESLQRQFDRAKGKRRYSLKRQMIETWQQMYVIRASKNQARCLSHAKDMARMRIPEEVTLDDDDMPQSDAMITLLNPAHISFLLENYSALRAETRDDTHCDMWCLLVDLERLVLQVFPKDTELRRIMLMKMLGYSNAEIASAVERDFGSTHTKQYYSMVWRQRIPKMLCHQAQKNYIVWYWRQPENHVLWKRCSRCGQMRPAHHLFFTKNNSKDGFYSVCRDCGHSTKQSKRSGDAA